MPNMPIGRITRVVLAAVLPQLLSAQRVPDANRTKRPPTVSDAIRMTKLSEPDRAPAQFSPDGSAFFVVLQKGNIDNNTVEYSIEVFQTHDILASPVHGTVLTFASSSNGKAISQAHWLADSRRISFLGEHSTEPPQVYTVDIVTRKVEKLTNHGTAILAYATSGDGKRIVYTAEEPCEEALKPENWRQGFVIGSERLNGFVTGDCRQLSYYTASRIYTITRGSDRVTRVDAKLYSPSTSPLISISPDGRFAVINGRIMAPPEQWKEYRDQLIQVQLKKLPGVAPAFIPMDELMLVDLESRTVDPLLTSPLMPPLPSLAWSPDSRSITVDNSWLPLDGVNATDWEQRRSYRGGAVIGVPDRRLVKAWMHTPGTDPIQSSNSEGSNDLAVTLDQDMNTPPKLFVTDRASKHRALLMDLNPQFQEISLAPVEELKWRAKNDDEWNAGLFLPLNYVAGRRYPLVIQTRAFNPKIFSIDGGYTTANAAQALAGRGVMVLQLGYGPNRFETVDTTNEAPLFEAAVEAAIDQLDQRHMIDRERVGLIGFSRTAWFVEYFLTHSSYSIAAATISDGVDFSYVQYILFPHLAVEYEPANGAAPFGEGLREWLKNAPGFNLDKIRAPVRIEALRPASLLGEWELYVGLRRLGKPVDMIYTPDGAHPLVKPFERIMSQQGNVDWFCFWLKGEENPATGNAGQYARWRALQKSRSSTAPALSGTPGSSRP